MDKKLLTPGPLTTSITTKEAMLHDWGSRDKQFIDLNQSIRDSLVKLIDGQDAYQCVPMQGSGTFAVESMVSSLTAKDSKILIISLEDKNEHIRSRAAQALGRIGATSSIIPLIKSLNDKYWFARCRAAEALGNVQG